MELRPTVRVHEMFNFLVRYQKCISVGLSNIHRFHKFVDYGMKVSISCKLLVKKRIERKFLKIENKVFSGAKSF